MNQYEVDPVAEKAWQILLHAIHVGKIPEPEDCFKLAEDFHREGVRRGHIIMDPIPQSKENDHGNEVSEETGTKAASGKAKARTP